MKKRSLAVCVVLSFVITACNTNPKKSGSENTNNSPIEAKEEPKMKDLTFTLAKNYFVKNTVKKLDDPKIETLEKFNEIFGMAATMSKDGKPTAIDFSKQFVIAVVKPETDFETSLTPIRIQKYKGDEIELTYKTIVGPKQTFTTRPNMIVIVNKSENGKVVLRELN